MFNQISNLTDDELIMRLLHWQEQIDLQRMYISDIENYISEILHALHSRGISDERIEKVRILL